ncbi:MAG: aminomethyl-transferring glycine dehydrogenase subunit GcvPA [Clostridiales bacterium]|nr:aminomethyl-transferring glycine dehydrogenase subunit GcvPA [Clostridiales bacterium]
MGRYIPAAPAEQRQLLEAVGVASFDELFAVIPKELRIGGLCIEPGKSELEVSALLRGMADKNRVFPVIFRGAGAYHHFIPPIVRSVAGKEEFVTSYTPYQAEISQGLLQLIFEYQTMICELTGMDLSNASVYDGASAAAEAVTMCRERGRSKALIAASSHPMVIRTMRTYCESADTELVVVPEREGRTDAEALAALLDGGVACLYVQQLNFHGLIEDADALFAQVHAADARAILGVNPIAAGLLKSAGACGADIAVGEGQPLGMPLAFGGPYLGFMACTKALMRRIPGRVVGETLDAEGRRAFVLTLQAREQHIRREKASSNICSNQAHCALTAGAYLTAMGPDGLRQAASLCYAKAHYLAQRLCEIEGVALAHPGDFFHEFVTTLPCPPEALLDRLAQQGVLGGLPVQQGILWCCTELNTREQIDELVNTVREVCGA